MYSIPGNTLQLTLGGEQLKQLSMIYKQYALLEDVYTNCAQSQYKNVLIQVCTFFAIWHKSLYPSESFFLILFYSTVAHPVLVGTVQVVTQM